MAEAMFEVILSKNYSKLSKDSFKLDIQEALQTPNMVIQRKPHLIQHNKIKTQRKSVKRQLAEKTPQLS